MVKLLLATGRVDPDPKNRNGETPLHKAAYRGGEAVVKLLLATCKVDANSTNKFGKTPLRKAEEERREPIIKLLLAAGPQETEKQENSAL